MCCTLIKRDADSLFPMSFMDLGIERLVGSERLDTDRGNTDEQLRNGTFAPKTTSGSSMSIVRCFMGKALPIAPFYEAL